MKAENFFLRPQHNLRETLAWASAAALGAAALTFGFLFFHHQDPVPPPVRFTVNTPGNGSLPLFGRPAVSPDGRSVLFGVIDPATKQPVWYLYSLATASSRLLPGTESIIAAHWSFDNRSVLLSRSPHLWKMNLNAGSRQRLPVAGAYSSWQAEGIVTGGRSGLRSFRPDGSGLRWIRKRNDKNGAAYSYPTLIPGGRWLVYNMAESDGFSLHFASLDGKVDRKIFKTEHPAIYAAPGYLLFRRGHTLTAQRFDSESGNLRGDEAPIASPVVVTAGTADQLGSFSASDNGVLAFREDVQDAPNRFTVIVNWPSLLKKK